MDYIIFDTETTGLPMPDAAPLAKQPQIIEYAGIRVNWESLVERDRLSFFANPGVKLPARIIEITGLTDADLEGEPPFSASYATLVDFHLGAQGLAGHNLAFDHSLMEYEMRRMGTELRFPWPPEHACTVEATINIKGYRLHLNQLHEMATGEPHAGAHRAMVDAEATLEVIRWLRGKELL